MIDQGPEGYTEFKFDLDLSVQQCSSSGHWQVLFWHWRPGFGNRNFTLLLETFGTFRELCSSPSYYLKKGENISENTLMLFG
jgi:hypothetical protein